MEIDLLCEAVTSNDLTSTKLLLEYTPSTHGSNVCNVSVASSSGDIKSTTNHSLTTFIEHEKDVIDQSILVNNKQNGVSLLNHAIINNNVEMIKLLIHHGGEMSCSQFSHLKNINTLQLDDIKEFGSSISPLILAVCGGDSHTVATVLANLTTPSSSWDALRLASLRGLPEIVKILLPVVKSYPEPLDGNVSQKSLLFYAAERCDNEELIKILLENKFSPSTKDDADNSVLHSAAKTGCLANLDLFMAVSVSPCIVNNVGKSPFHVACKYGHCEVLEMLLKHTCSSLCDFNAKRFLLHEAAKYSKTSTVKLLLDYGFSVNQLDDFAMTALLEAVKCDCFQVVEVLLEAGADTNIPSTPYELPILYAAKHSSPEIVEALLKAGADVNTTDLIGRSPLINSARRSNKADITGLLLKYGADMNHKYLHAYTPLDIAISKGNIACAKVLIDAQAILGKTPCPVQLYLAKNRECAELLLQSGVPVDVPELCKKTPLMCTTWENKVEVAQVLIEHGADVNRTTQDGASPLFYSISNDSPALVRDLLLAGARVDGRVLDKFCSMLELALFVGAGNTVCRLLYLAGATISPNFTEKSLFHNSSAFLHFLTTSPPPDAFQCHMWIKLRLAVKYEHLDRLCESATRYSRTLTLENLCYKELRRLLSYDKPAMCSLFLPKHMSDKLKLEAL